ncbi:MAG TPA: PilN domain-containing protein [Candidatus Limnocylindria bacterium]|jgi:Tfp pilus assembly protein PilN|nr:PilN domain-containing protein [Candidatus Limnocylindria bacterium]
MTRIDYLVSRWELLLGVAPPAAVPRTLRDPLIALLASLVLLGVLAGVQAARLAHARRDVEIVRQRLAQDDSALRRLDALEVEVRRLHAIDGEIDRIAEAGAHSVSAVAAIGNRIPKDAWLSSIRRDHDGYVLEGSARRLSLVSRTLAALAALPATGRARLVSVQDAPAGRGVGYAITLGPAR